MNKTETAFMTLVNKMTESNPDVFLGKMMSSPGLKCKDRVFAFYNKGEMGFKLGPEFDPSTFGLKNARPLNPFKTKPPLKGWYVVSADEYSFWGILTTMALEYTKLL